MCAIYVSGTIINLSFDTESKLDQKNKKKKLKKYKMATKSAWMTESDAKTRYNYIHC